MIVLLSNFDCKFFLGYANIREIAGERFLLQEDAAIRANSFEIRRCQTDVAWEA